MPRAGTAKTRQLTVSKEYLLEYAVAQDNSMHGQDRYLVEANLGLFAVADGVSALSSSGEVAQTVLDRLFAWRNNMIELREVFNCTLTGVTFPSKGATTLSAVVLGSSGAICFNVGDSKTQVFDDGKEVFRSSSHEIEDTNGILVLGAWILGSSSEQDSTLVTQRYVDVPIAYELPEITPGVQRTYVLSTDGISERFAFELVQNYRDTTLQEAIDKLMKIARLALTDDRTVTAVTQRIE